MHKSKQRGERSGYLLLPDQVHHALSLGLGLLAEAGQGLGDVEFQHLQQARAADVHFLREP